MDIVPFRPEHLRSLVLQEAQAWMGPMLKADYGEYLLRGGPCFTALDGERVLACSGVLRMWDNRDQAWALMAQDAGRRFVKIFRGMSRFLDLHDTRRIEATVDCEFEEGHRLMRMLGFRLEAERMRAYLPDGRDAALYARVRGQ